MCIDFTSIFNVVSINLSLCAAICCGGNKFPVSASLLRQRAKIAFSVLLSEFNNAIGQYDSASV